MARQAVATDDFNRGDGDLGSNWSEGSGIEAGAKPQVSSNTLTNDTDDASTNSFWNADSFADDQYSKLDVTTWGNSGVTYMGLQIRDDANDSVILQATRPTTGKLKIYWYNGGGYTEIAAADYAYSDGEEIIAEAEGTQFTMYFDDVSKITGSNASAPSGGAPGITMNDTTDVTDNWEGGDLVAAIPSRRLLRGVGR